MPRKGVKQLNRVTEEAVRIRCRYCDIRESCDRRERKESYEEQGLFTYCAITPNRLKPKR